MFINHLRKMTVAHIGHAGLRPCEDMQGHVESSVSEQASAVLSHDRYSHCRLHPKCLWAPHLYFLGIHAGELGV